MFRYNLVGTTLEERAEADEIVQAINDLMDHLFEVIFPDDVATRKAKNKEAIEKFRNV